MKKILLLIIPLLLVGCAKQAEEKSVTQDYFSTLAGAVKQAKDINVQTKQAVLDYEAEQEIESAEDNNEIWYSVAKIVDGDTLDVEYGGKTERIRLIGINTPESVDPRTTVECFGKEASAKAGELLAGHLVRLEADSSQTDRDKYDRLLRYLWTKEGLFYNLEIIKQGYAYEYTYDMPYKYQAEFKTAQQKAQNEKVGLWADGACGAKNAD